jgi:hypothetical protein
VHTVRLESAKGAPARQAGVEFPKHEDIEQPTAELKARSARTMVFEQSLKPAQLADMEGKEIGSSPAAKRSSSMACNFCPATHC